MLYDFWESTVLHYLSFSMFYIFLCFFGIFPLFVLLPKLLGGLWCIDDCIPPPPPPTPLPPPFLFIKKKYVYIFYFGIDDNIYIYRETYLSPGCRVLKD